MNSADRVQEVLLALRKSIETMADGPSAKTPVIAAQWPRIGRFLILRWVDDFGRLLNRGAASLDSARSAGATAEGRDALDLALWSLDAARERLLAVACLTLNVQVLNVTTDKRSVRFRVNPRRLAARLRELESDHPEAQRVNELGLAAAQHVATEHRNELSHTLSQIPEVGPLVWMDRVAVAGGVQVATESLSLFPSGRFLKSGDISADAVWATAVSDVKSGLDLITETAETLADLIVSAGELGPPVPVYWDNEKGEVNLEKPGIGG